ncbi:MAG: hypothetical protein AAFW69_08235 [Pseudomonadota bacterium]
MAEEGARAASELLNDIASELAALARIADGVQHDVADLCELVSAAGDPIGIDDLQALDRLTQSLDDLARFHAVLATQVPAAWSVDAAAAAGELDLAELAARLSGRVPDVVDAGEPDFF